MTLWFALACTQGDIAPLWSGQRPGERMAADGFPEVVCTSPLDEAIIYRTVVSSAAVFYGSNSVWAWFIGHMSSLPPHFGTSKSYSMYGQDEYDGEKLVGVAGGDGEYWGSFDEHPVEMQGEQTNRPDAVYGDYPEYKFTVDLSWEDEDPFGDLTTTFQGTLTDNFHYSALCLSQIREQRITGMFTFWGDPETADNWFPPHSLALVLDYQEARTPDDTGTARNKWVYAPDSRQTVLRNLGAFLPDYPTDFDPDVWWGEEAKRRWQD